MNPGMLFIIDFDGTVAPTDTVDALLERFAHPDWRAVEAQWVRGEINSQQCMAAQLAMVRTDQSVVRRFLEQAEIDPSFPEFVTYARGFADLAVVSDGLDYTILHSLRSIEPPVPIYANALEFRTQCLGIGFPHADAACIVSSGVCKCAVARNIDAGRGVPTILIGDGQSDTCVARTVSHVFAKGSLLRFCVAENIAHTPFETFADVMAVLREWGAHEAEDAVGRLNVT